jgi:type IV secretory pathway VirB3-like protein
MINLREYTRQHITLGCDLEMVVMVIMVTYTLVTVPQNRIIELFTIFLLIISLLRDVCGR